MALGDATICREDGRGGYVWHLGTSAGVRYYEYHHSRAGAVANAALGEDFAGVLVSDLYAAYNDTPGGQHQRCWVHLLHALHALHARAHGRGGGGRLGPGRQAPLPAGHGPRRAVARRLLRHQGELFTFVLRDDVPADHHGAERGARPVVVCREISGGRRSRQGSETRMILTSLMGSWRAQGLNPLDACRRLLHGPFPPTLISYEN